MTLKQQVVSGVSWFALANVTKQILYFIVTVFLARLLEPEAFGLIGMISVFTRFAVHISELGFTGALIQHRNLEERHLSSIFWLNIVVGLLFSIVFVVTGPLLASFYGEPLLSSVAAIIGLSIFIGAFNDVQTALLQRSMSFYRLLIVEITSISIAGVIAIMMAYTGFGIWSLVAQVVIDTILGVIVMWLTTSWRPKFIFDWKAVKELLYFSSNLLGFQVFNYWVRNTDNLLIGRYVNVESLGFYIKAYSLMLLPVTQITRVLAPVLFPAFSHIQDDHQRIKTILLRMHRVITLVSAPMICGMLVTANSFVVVIYGEKWVMMIPILQALCIVGLAQPTTTTMGIIFKSQGRTDLQFRWSMFSGIITITGFLIGVRWGVMGVVVSLLIREYLLLYPTIAIPGKLIGLSFGEYVTNLISLYGLSFIMALVVWWMGSELLTEMTPLNRLLIQITGGILIYSGLVLFIKPLAYRDLLSLIPKRRIS